MLCKTNKAKSVDALYKVSFTGITAMGDMALWKGASSDNPATVILISLYGSDNQVRGIFSALVTNHEINIDGEILARGWEGNLRFKSRQIGYGKYHAIVWNEKLVSDCIIAFDPAKEKEAWESFLQKKRIPFLKDWIPQIVSTLKNEALVESIAGKNLTGWYFTASDDEVCDLIVKEIYK